MKTITLCLVSLMICVTSSVMAKKTNDELKMFVGTYTEGGNSKGIYLYHFNQETGDVSKETTSASTGNPSYLAVGKGGNNVYAVNEYNDGKQGISSFRYNMGTDGITFIGKQSTMNGNYKSNKEIKYTNLASVDRLNPFIAKGIKDGGDPCFILTNGDFALTANYTGGDISVFPIDKTTGNLQKQSQHFCFNGDTIGAVSHIHCLQFTPDGKYIIATDLGNDCIYRFNVNPSNRTLLSNCVLAYRGHRGNGPRHIIFSADGKYAYLINELGGQLTVFSYNDGILTKIQETMADEGGGHGSAEIMISPNGKFLYTSHRLKEDGISIFKVDRSNGKVAKLGYQFTGTHPRFFTITPNGKYLLVACRDSNEIQIFGINSSTGALTDTHKTIRVDKPVCIVFI